MDQIVLHAAKNIVKTYSVYKFIRLKREYISVQGRFKANATEFARVFADIYVRDVNGLEFINNYSIDIVLFNDGKFKFTETMNIMYSLDFFTNQLVQTKT